MNEPEFRFKADDGSEFPEWEQQKLSDIADYSKDKISATNVSPEDYVSTDNMLQDYAGIVDSETVPNTGTLCSFKSGDILMSNIRPYLKKIWLANKNGGCNSDVLVIRPNNSQNPQFVFALLARDDFISYVMTGAKGSKMPRGDKAFIMNYAIPDICIEEQQKIADLFSALDNVIVSVQKEVDSWEQMKRGMMQKLFSQEVRFKADDGSEFPEWEEKLLGDIIDYEQPGKYIVESTEYKDDGIPVLTAGKSFILGYTTETDGIKHADNENPVIIFDDFTTASHIVTFNFKVKSSAMKLLTGRPNKSNTYFDGYLISTLQYEPKGHSRKWISEFVTMKLAIPCIEEQQKIADCLSELDSVIEKTKQKLEAYKQLKKGLMQRMFV